MTGNLIDMKLKEIGFPYEVLKEYVKDNKNFFKIVRGGVTFKLPKHYGHKCVGCGNCCRDNLVAVTTTEIKQINMFLQRHKKLRHLKDKWTEVITDPKLYTKLPSTSGFWIKRVETKPIILSGIESNIKCIFLDENNKCIIYKIRPIICRKYPYGMVTFNPMDITKSEIGYKYQGNNMDFFCHGFHKGKRFLKELNEIAIAQKEFWDDMY